ncbi:MAG TPA: polyphosphate kinase 2 family protein [Acidimicrobiia bacterium]|nr:polyphosphate kinase 2 family protein [Acidimicrobiia bacterium]
MIDVAAYRVPEGAQFDLSSHDPGSKAGFAGQKKDGRVALEGLKRHLAELQRRLWAESKQSLLVVLQAIDTGGKDGTIRHVFSGVNPQGVRVVSFGKPNDRELAQDYLWRIHRETPADGFIKVFNRSHYEDVLVVRVKELVSDDVWSRRYRHIREFERMLSDEGTTIVKLHLHISKDEQKKRLRSRLEKPNKNWKFNKADLADRELWEDYQRAFQDAIQQTSTDYAPWYVVPANRKWYRNLVVSSILIQTLEAMSPRYPEPESGLEDVVIV